MLRYIGRRMLQMIPVFFGATLLIYALVFLMPGDPVEALGGDRGLTDIAYVENVSDSNDEVNGLAPIADRYPQVLVSAKAGDVVFFGGHVLHRSKKNFTTNVTRRSFVSHYCNARSFTQWGAASPSGDPHAAQTVDPVTKMTNGSHILARGDSHLDRPLRERPRKVEAGTRRSDAKPLAAARPVAIHRLRASLT